MNAREREQNVMSARATPRVLYRAASFPTDGARYRVPARGALDPRDSTVYISYWEDSGWETFDKVTPDGVITTIDRGSRGGTPGGRPGTLVDENGQPVISDPRYLGPLAMGPDGTIYAAAPNALLTLHGLPER